MTAKISTNYPFTQNTTKEFAGKVIIVTGASKPNGIGSETARKFAQEGAQAIVITSRQHSETEAKIVTEQLKELGTKVLWIPGDISDPNTPRHIIETTKQAFGQIDVIVNNAGVKIDKPINSISTHDWDSVLNTNLRAAYFMIREAANIFSKDTGGAIINTGSIVGTYGNTGQANYAAAKSGLIGLTRSAAIDLGRRNIRVNVVLPGFVGTDMTNSIGTQMKEVISDATPLGRLGTPGDIANCIVFLASSKAAFITGQAIAIDGGLDGGVVGITGLLRAGYKKK